MQGGGYEGNLFDLLSKDGGRCEKMRCRGSRLTVHVWPRSAGGLGS